MISNAAALDARYVWERSEPLWRELSGQRLFLTGGTGFFGRSLLEVLVAIGDTHGLRFDVTVLARDPDGFKKAWPQLGNSKHVRFHRGDIAGFPLLNEHFEHIIHAATPASARLNIEHPSLMFRTIVDGTARMLDQAERSQVRRFLFVSSGAVYGRQPSELTHVPETYAGAPDPLSAAAAYGEGKRAAELMCTLAAKDRGLHWSSARCFAFVGPHLPLDGTFAIGNFIRDVLAGRQLRINGDGSPFRSYLYSADLVVWLTTILLKGENGRSYNVGSDRDLDIKSLAHTVLATLGSGAGLHIDRPPSGAPPERYVPSIDRARGELGLDVGLSLDEAIRRTAAAVGERGFHV